MQEGKRIKIKTKKKQDENFALRSLKRKGFGGGKTITGLGRQNSAHFTPVADSKTVSNLA